MKNIYKVSLWKMFKPNIYALLLVLCFTFLMSPLLLLSYIEKSELLNTIILVTVLFDLLFGLPNLIIHLNYYLCDKNKVLSINTDDRSFDIIDKAKEYSLLFNDIAKITRVGKRPFRADLFYSTSPLRYFYFYKIEMKNGDLYYISRYLIQNLEKKVANINFEHKESRWPYIKQKEDSIYIYYD